MSQNTFQQLIDVMDLVAQPVLVIENNLVIYRNPAAAALVPLGLPGHYIYGDASLDEMMSFNMQGQDFTASVKKLEDGKLLLVCKPFEQNDVPMNYLPVIASQIRSPLVDLFAAARGLLPDLEDLDNDYEVTDYACRIYKGLYRLQRLACQLSDGSQLAQGNFYCFLRRTEVTEIFESICRDTSFMLRDSSLRFDFTPLTETKYADVDAKLLERAIWNILSNAFKHCKTNGLVQFHAECNPDEILIRVTNDGHIPAKELASMFHRYAQPIDPGHMPDGIGFGMAIAHQIAKMHGGTLVVNNCENDTTVVTMSIKSHSELTRFSSPIVDIGSEARLAPALVELSDILPASNFHPLEIDA